MFSWTKKNIWMFSNQDITNQIPWFRRIIFRVFFKNKWKECALSESNLFENVVMSYLLNSF